MTKPKIDFFVIFQICVALAGGAIIGALVQPEWRDSYISWIMGLLISLILLWDRSKLRSSLLLTLTLFMLTSAFFFEGILALVYFVMAEFIYFASQPSHDDIEEQTSKWRVIPLLTNLLIVYSFYLKGQAPWDEHLICGFLIFRSLLWVVDEHKEAESFLYTFLSPLVGLMITDIKMTQEGFMVIAIVALVCAITARRLSVLALAMASLYLIDNSLFALFGPVLILASMKGWPRQLSFLVVALMTIPVYLKNAAIETQILLSALGVSLALAWVNENEKSRPTKKQGITLAIAGVFIGVNIYWDWNYFEELPLIESWEPLSPIGAFAIFLMFGLALRLRRLQFGLSFERVYRYIARHLQRYQLAREFADPKRNVMDLQLPESIDSFFSDYRITTALTLGLFAALLWGIVFIL